MGRHGARGWLLQDPPQLRGEEHRVLREVRLRGQGGLDGQVPRPLDLALTKNLDHQAAGCSPTCALAGPTRLTQRFESLPSPELSRLASRELPYSSRLGISSLYSGHFASTMVG